MGLGEPHTQTVQALRNIEESLHKAGALLRDVVRTRIYVTNMDHWEEVGSAHAKLFGEIRPVTTMVEVSRLLSPDMLVEIEAEAIIKGTFNVDEIE